MSSKRARYRRKVERRAGHPRWRRVDARVWRLQSIGDTLALIEPGLWARFAAASGVLHVFDTRDAVLTIHAGDRNGLEL